MEPMAWRTAAERTDGKNAGVGAPYHALPATDILALLGVSADLGLTDDEAMSRLERKGPNTIESRRKVSVTRVLLHQFRSPVVYLLGAAAALGVYFGEWKEASAIAIVLVLNAMIGFVTELKAARSIEALRTLGTCSVRVRRDGHVRLISAEQMVPGDIVIVDAGDAIAADMRLLEGSNVAADESTLTGESVAVDKSAVPVAPDARLADRSSMLFKGTFVTRGNGIGVVVSTGLLTELGRVSQLIEEADPGRSPLENKLARLSAQLIWVTLILSAVIAAIGIATGEDIFLMIESAIALAVAAIPEGLPIVATLALARGMWRMAQQDALIERLSAVETLGATTIILTDKTGTLTENRMTVRRLWVSSGEIDFGSGQAIGQSFLSDDPQVSSLLEIGILCNDAVLESVDERGSGDPMELALLRVGLRAGLRRSKLLRRGRLVRKYAFDSSTKMMAMVQDRGDGFLFVVKGAPEEVLAASTRVISQHGKTPMGSNERREWLKRVDELGRHGLRVLACGMKMDMQEGAAPYEGLTFVGLLGLEDPARADVAPAVQACRQAGIRVVMVTGDHAVTARSIARAVGFGHDANNVVEGRQLDRLTRSNNSGLTDIGIFARVSPAEKLALVRAFQDAGEIVAMTGDGVNDAPALRQADIGVAMGLRGTDVARQAAAMILLDDAFPTIVKAIREGRVIFANIRRFAAYLLACNLTEVLTIGLPVLSTLPLPILPLQILYLNLVTDIFPAFALAMGEGDSRILKRPPRDPQEPILGHSQWVTIVLQSLAMTAGTLGAFAVARMWLNLNTDAAVTVTFLTLAFAQLWHVFNMRNPHSGLMRNEITGNGWIWGSLVLCIILLAVPPYVPTMANILHLAAPNATMWGIVFVMSLAPMLIIQASMLVLRWFSRSSG
jgi:P-type Ca2+ transporter type 2C